MKNWKQIIAGVGAAAMLVSNTGSVAQTVFANEPIPGWESVESGDNAESETLSGQVSDDEIMVMSSEDGLTVTSEGAGEGASEDNTDDGDNGEASDVTGETNADGTGNTTETGATLPTDSTVTPPDTTITVPVIEDGASETVGTEGDTTTESVFPEETTTEDAEDEGTDSYEAGEIKNYLESSGVEVRISYDADAEIPAGATLKVDTLSDDLAQEYAIASAQALEHELASSRFYDIEILDEDGEAIQLHDTVTVTITYDTPFELKDNELLRQVQIVDMRDDEEEAETEDAEVSDDSTAASDDENDEVSADDDAENPGEEDAAASESEETDEQDIYVERLDVETTQENGLIKTISFEQSDLLVTGTLVAVTESEFKDGELTTRVESAGANITVSYDEDAQIPADATLEAWQLSAEEAAEYEARIANELGEDTEITASRYFEIHILNKDGERIQPETPVTISISYDEPLTVTEDQEILQVHFRDTTADGANDDAESAQGDDADAVEVASEIEDNEDAASDESGNADDIMMTSLDDEDLSEDEASSDEDIEDYDEEATSEDEYDDTIEFLAVEADISGDETYKVTFEQDSFSVGGTVVLASEGDATAGVLASSSLTPKTSKTVTSNKDGTYNITLSVTGDKDLVNKKIDVVFLFDISNTMKDGKKDGTNDYARLKAVRESIKTALKKLKSINEEYGETVARAGLITFNAEVKRVSGFTGNIDSVINKVEKITRKKLDYGTNWQGALAEANSMEPESGRKKIVVLVSDGEPTIRSIANGYKKDYNAKVTGYYGNANEHDKTNVKRNYKAAKGAARTVVTSGGDLYVVTVVGGSKYGRLLVNYAYSGHEDDDSRSDGHYFYSSEPSKVANRLKNVMTRATAYMTMKNVVLTDGITSLTAVDSTPTFTYSKNVPQSARNAEYNSSTHSVTWNMGSYTLVRGQTYSVTFRVWPSQRAYDIQAAYKNGLIAWGNTTTKVSGKAVSTAEWNQLSKDSSGKISVKTNTGQKVTWTQVTHSVKDTNKNGSADIPMTGNPMPLNWHQVNITKTFINNVDSVDYSSGIGINLLQDSSNYIAPLSFTKNTSDVKRIVWSGSAYVSPGLILVNGSNYQVLDAGHDYTFTESGANLVQWERSGGEDIYRPMLVGYSENNLYIYMFKRYGTSKPSSGTYYKIGNYYYVALGSASTTTNISINNTRVSETKGTLNLTKVLDGADEDVTFEFVVEMDGKDCDNVKIGIVDNKGSEVSVYENVWKEGTGKLHYGSEGGYETVNIGCDNDALHINVMAGWTVTFYDLDKDDFWSFEEESKEGYSFVKWEETVDKSSEVIASSTTSNYSTGNIEAGKDLTVTYTNKKNISTLSLTKVVQDVNGKEYTLDTTPFEFLVKFIVDTPIECRFKVTNQYGSNAHGFTDLGLNESLGRSDNDGYYTARIGNSGIDISIRPGWTVTFYDLPDGLKYSISEYANSEYTQKGFTVTKTPTTGGNDVTYTSDIEVWGKINGYDLAYAVTCTNCMKTLPVSLSLTKKVEGDEDNADEFGFTINFYEEADYKFKVFYENGVEATDSIFRDLNYQRNDWGRSDGYYTVHLGHNSEKLEIWIRAGWTIRFYDIHNTNYYIDEIDRDGYKFVKAEIDATDGSYTKVKTEKSISGAIENSYSYTVTYTNEKLPDPDARLSLTKNVEGGEISDDKFKFNIQLANPNIGGVVQARFKVFDAKGSELSDSGFRYINSDIGAKDRNGYYLFNIGQSATDLDLTILNGWTVRFYDLLDGTNYSINEEVADGFEFVKAVVTKVGDDGETNEVVSYDTSAINGEITSLDKLHEVVYTNKTRTATLSLTKVVEGNALDIDSFKFIVRLEDNRSDEDAPIYFQIFESDGNLVGDETFKELNPSILSAELDGATYYYLKNDPLMDYTQYLSIKAGWTVRFVNLNLNTQFGFTEILPTDNSRYTYVKSTVTEVAADGNSSVISTNTSTKYIFGSVAKDGVGYEVTFTNKRNPEPPSTLTLTKAIDGAADDTTPFEFHLTLNDPEVTEGGQVLYQVFGSDGKQVNDATFKALNEINETIGTTTKDSQTYYVVPYDDGLNAAFNIKAGWSVKFYDLSVGTTYSIEEERTDGYQFERSAVTKSTGGAVHSVDSTATTGRTTEGSISVGNTDYRVTYTNKPEASTLSITKVMTVDNGIDVPFLFYISLMDEEETLWLETKYRILDQDGNDVSIDGFEEWGTKYGTYGAFTKTEEIDGYTYYHISSSIFVPIKAGWTIRFYDIEPGSHYYICEYFGDQTDAGIKDGVNYGHNCTFKKSKVTYSTNGGTPTIDYSANADVETTGYMTVNGANYQVTYTNEMTDFEMPDTGGAGTLPIELGGSAAMLTAMFVGYQRRRRDRKEGEN